MMLRDARGGVRVGLAVEQELARRSALLEFACAAAAEAGSGVRVVQRGWVFEAFPDGGVPAGDIWFDGQVV